MGVGCWCVCGCVAVVVAVVVVVVVVVLCSVVLCCVVCVCACVGGGCARSHQGFVIIAIGSQNDDVASGNDSNQTCIVCCVGGCLQIYVCL